MKYWIFLHHKCASQYLRAQISAVGQAAGWLTAISALNSMDGPPTLQAMQAMMDQTDYNLDDNAWPESVPLLDAWGGDWKAVHFVRDPRDLLVSAYWSHRYSHALNIEGLVEHRARLETATIEEGLLLDLDYPITRQAIESVLHFPRHWRLLTVDAIAAGSQRTAFMNAVDWIDLPVAADFALPAWRPGIDQRQDGGDEDNTRHQRHGVQGDWQRYFTPAVAQVFMDQYGAQMQAQGWLGYAETR